MIERKPLTLEELRKMDGKPVWVECLKPQKYTCPPVGWRILSKAISGRFGVWNKESCLIERDYGTDWTAYDHEPPRLDRSAWELCEFCEDYSGKCCANCWYGGNQAYQEPCGSCYCASKWKPKKNFCSACGRPLTDAAWKTLEKRLEINK